MKWSILVLAILISACLSPETVYTEEPIEVEDCITLEELQSDELCLIVVENFVYDLTESDVWGHDYLHGGQLECGQDHTSALAAMPHSRTLFEPFQIGELC